MRIGRARIWDSQGLARIWDLGRVLAGIWGGSWLGSGVVLAGIWGGSNSEGGGRNLGSGVEIWSKMTKITKMTVLGTLWLFGHVYPLKRCFCYFWLIY